ncbi:MAG: hypothetical protein FLDDKLPJ_02811 [Phycisphaerae bacterium]|nr:hypothetical protein [Phycisphaerae bacterium]
MIQPIEETADIRAVFDDDSIIDQAMRDAVRDALLDHKRTGDPIVVWQDGKVVWIPADQIVVDDDPQPQS